jgi:hypothetical protein
MLSHMIRSEYCRAVLKAVFLNEGGERVDERSLFMPRPFLIAAQGLKFLFLFMFACVLSLTNIVLGKGLCRSFIFRKYSP